jgi:hypothetical protein
VSKLQLAKIITSVGGYSGGGRQASHSVEIYSLLANSDETLI